MLKRCALAAVLAGFAQIPAHAEFFGNAESETLAKQADVLAAKRQYQDAINTFQAAAKADPKASRPVSSLAALLYTLSDMSKGEQHDRLRGQAEALARRALAITPQDPNAQETLRKLQDQPLALHTPTQEAQQALSRGEVLFTSGKYAEALAAYEQAAQLDPLASEAWVYAGDCFFSQKNWPEAEQRFRKATEVEPLNSQAWRFLADALIQQNKGLDAQAALFSAIAAQPSQLPNWEKLSQYRIMVGYPLKALQLKPRASVSKDAAGKRTINLDMGDAKGAAGDAKNADSANLAVWMTYAAADMVDDPLRAAGLAVPDTTAFMKEVNAWTKALQVAQDVIAKGDGASLDPGLLQMLSFAKDKQLDHAVLVLRYRETYRAELEAWKKADPDGIRKFVNAYNVRP